MARASDNQPVDVLIIGAGASGAAVAWSLADTRMHIVCLEQGDWPHPAEYPSNRSDWESHQFGSFSIDPNVRGLETDYPINNDESPITVVNFNGVGGGTILYAAHFPRLHPSDFKVRTLDGVAEDWPVSYEQLEPYFSQNDRMMGVSGLAGDPMYPPKQPPLPPVPLGLVGETVARGYNKLGWHWWPSDSAIVSRPYEGRDKCLNLGPCMSGCSQGAKSSTDITYWPEAIRAGVELRTRCRVREITLNGDGMADGVIYYDEEGSEVHQKAEIVVMACNGVGTPRILLNSRSERFPEGLANSSGLVGKNLMFHPVGFVQGVFEERLDSHKGPSGCCILSKEFYETDLSRGFVRGYNMQITRGPGPLATALGGFASGTIPWGPGHHEAFRKRFDHIASIGVLCEDLPEEHNCVTLDPELVDSDGIPAPRIQYQLSENSTRMLEYGLARAEEVMEAAGATEIYNGGLIQVSGWHLLGTARMGNDPATSVVNSWGRSHDVKNLFIVDGSVFVTAGGVNPTSTIQALALYVADTMKKNLANLFD
ncbi:MAG: GMC family oxidoreductase [Pseudomonadales bacterium]|jgi:choline dehydrogenase-like flavoprotein|nr:GMC family oxidoreductase [Pseudomonadales bacterium]MDP6472831.1 GMC family oxidoreductase [Pseudomonadales bacterium]MDP6828047.1 GMC family oxidoreductase [Pseudomonadales bacterium]MDP6971740.1 GMC family oxidoreductase [Pseudomonadales bacterium]